MPTLSRELNRFFHSKNAVQALAAFHALSLSDIATILEIHPECLIPGRTPRSPQAHVVAMMIQNSGIRAAMEARIGHELYARLNRIDFSYYQNSINRALESDMIAACARRLSSIGINSYKQKLLTTVLIYSVIHKDMVAMQASILMGANLHCKDVYGNNLLSYALKNRHMPSVYFLIARGVVEIPDLTPTLTAKDLQDMFLYGYTPLMLAITKLDFIQAKQCLNSQTIHDCDDDGYSALEKILHMSVSQSPDCTKLLQVAQFLLEFLQSGGFRLNISHLSVSNAQMSISDPAHFFEVIAYLDTMAQDAHGVHFFNDEQFKELVELTCSPEFSHAHLGKNFFHMCMEIGQIQFISKALNLFGGMGKLPHHIYKSLHALDMAQNSPASYFLRTLKHEEAASFLHLFQTYSLELIRNSNRVSLSYLHMQIIVSLQQERSMLQSEPLVIPHKEAIDLQDDDGRTPLHYACMLDHVDAINVLIARGADFNAVDKVGRTPLHYFAQRNGHFIIQPSITQINAQDVFGLTPLLLAAQTAEFGDLTSWTTAFAGSRLCALNRTLIEIVTKVICWTDGIGKLETILQEIFELSFTYQQKLALLACVDNIYHLRAQRYSSRVDICAKKILYAEFGEPKQTAFSADLSVAFGLEFELSGAAFTFVPDRFLARCYDFERVQDLSVASSVFSASPCTGTTSEYISAIIYSHAQLAQIFSLCEIWKRAGATVNKTTGFHVHVNCRGAVAHSPAIKALFTPNSFAEFVFVKILVINYIGIENLLRGFMREGGMFPPRTQAYLSPIGQDRKRILATQDLKELQRYCHHKTTLDLTALQRHGTIEFRIHEGLCDPVLLRAWLDAISRLVGISRAQAARFSGDHTQIEAFDNIENLVYVLVAMRNYKQTWVPGIGTMASTESENALPYPGFDSRPAQTQISENPLYTLLRITLDYDYSQHRSQTKPIVTKDHSFASTAMLFSRDTTPSPDSVTALTPPNNLSDILLSHIQPLQCADALQLFDELEELALFACDNPGIFNNHIPRDYMLAQIKMAKHALFTMRGEEPDTRRKLRRIMTASPVN